jgi:hypothetical protein
MTIADSTVKSIRTHGRYEPERLLGKGSYGSVFDACDPQCWIIRACVEISQWGLHYISRWTCRA